MKGIAPVYYKVLYWHLTGETGENHEKPVRLVSTLAKIWNVHMQVRSITTTNLPDVKSYIKHIRHV
jgi:hypothetical protein